MTPRRNNVRRAVLGFLATVATLPPPSLAIAATDTWCGLDLGGSWDAQNGRCTLSVAARQNATMKISVSVPVDLLDDPTAGPAIRQYALDLGRAWRKTGQTIPRDNTSTADFTVYAHSDAVKSVVFHEQFHTVGTNPNNAYRTFTFDLEQGRQLQLADLFAGGVDPLTAIPPIAQPYLVDALAQIPPPHAPGVYPFTSDRWEPKRDGSGFSSNYRSFALTADELVIYMPDSPMTHENPPPRGQWQWSMDGGTVQLHIPLSVLRSALATRFSN